MQTEITLKAIFFILILIAVVLEIIADILLKKWAIANKNWLLVIGLLVYFAGTIFWAFSLKYEYLSSAISIFTVLNLIVIALVGIIFFKEDLSVINKLGILLGIVSVVLIEM